MNSPEISPYLSAIQSLSGETAGEKYKKLHELTSVISSQTKDKDILTGMNTIPAALVPLARVYVGKKLKLNDLITEALKSNDSAIVNQALNARFFFDSSNSCIRVEYFKEKIIPYVSQKTLLQIVKKLSLCLMDNKKLAEEFFEEFAELYGINVAKPLLFSCGENFIYEKILKYKLVLPVRTLDHLLRKMPRVVVRYLQLGNQNNQENVKDRELHEIQIHQYSEFLPKLIKNYTKDFVELYKLTPHLSLKVGGKQTLLFLRQSGNTLVEEPEIFLKILNLKVVTRELTEDEFQIVFKKLFPKTLMYFSANTMIRYLKYYPEDKKYSLMSRGFQEVYGKDILTEIKLHDLRDLVEIMPSELKKQQLLVLSQMSEGNNMDLNPKRYLPPKTALPLIQELVSKESDMYARIKYLEDMIVSCHIYEDDKEFTNFLKYYNERHKNEIGTVFFSFLDCVKMYWFKKLDKNHWKIIFEIVQRAYVKDQLLHAPESVLEEFFGASLRHLRLSSDRITDNEDWYKKIINIIIEYKVLVANGEFNFVKESEAVERKILTEILNMVAQKYPADNEIWKKEYVKLNTITFSLKSIIDFNSRHVKKKSESIKPIEFQSFPWLINFTREFFATSTTYKNKRKELKYLLKKYEPEIFRQIIFNNSNVICSIETGEALDMLKRNPKEILKNWEQYLSNAKRTIAEQNMMGKKFLNAIKWYKDIPVMFVHHSLKNIKEDEKYLLVLGVLLEGQMFAKIITPFIPKESTIEVNSVEAKKYYKIASTIPVAINYTDPPVSLEIIASFCQGDYLSLAVKCLNSVARRVSIAKVMEFAKGIMSERVSLKKHGIRIIVQISTKEQLIEFLKGLWSVEKHYSIREILVKEIFNVFVEYPNDSNFNLMKKCVAEITLHEIAAFESICKISVIDKKYVGSYVTILFNKIEELTKDEEHKNKKEKFITDMLREIDEKSIKNIEQSIFDKIFEKYFFLQSSSSMSDCVKNFILKKYLFTTGEAFESRLEIVMNLLDKLISKWKKPSEAVDLRSFPENSALHDFVNRLINEAVFRKFVHSDRLFEKLLSIFSASLFPWQDPANYINLVLRKNVSSISSAKDFGEVYSKKISKLVNDFTSELILEDVSASLSAILQEKSGDSTNFQLEAMRELIENDSCYGAVVAAKMLNTYDVYRYDSKYESIIKSLDEKDNITVQFCLNKFLNSLS